ncbi:MAG: pyridoxamine 5'-phosphate oxidase family protein [Parcubacteria group bacterium]|nr:pyridoxamine 5'-phosphate oxidase family protein [Parcubacteria group bacterium]
MAINNQNEKKLIADFIKKHNLAVLATVNPEGKPEAAAIKFSVKNELNLIFDTSNRFRKYENFKNNRNVAVVIGWDQNITVQYEGIVSELSGEELAECKIIHIARFPDFAKFSDMDETRYFKIDPLWIRRSDFTVIPWEIYEVDFD